MHDHERVYRKAVAEPEVEVAELQEVEPGRASRSALLRKVDHPQASGLVSRAAKSTSHTPGVRIAGNHKSVDVYSSPGEPVTLYVSLYGTTTTPQHHTYSITSAGYHKERLPFIDTLPGGHFHLEARAVGVDKSVSTLRAADFEIIESKGGGV